MIEHQLPMSGMPRARNTDPQTSHEAAASVNNVSGVQRGILLSLTEKLGGRYHALGEKGRCDFDIATIYQGRRTGDPANYPEVSDSGLRTRRKELERMGFVEPSGYADVLPSGRKSNCYRVTLDGLVFLNE